MTKHPFEYQKPSVAQVESIEHLREACKLLYDGLMVLAPSRERSLAITKLEEVSMWANKAIGMEESA